MHSMPPLNFDNIPDNEITGVPDTLLEWITAESEHRYISELSKAFKNDISQIENETSPGCYQEVNEEIFEQLRMAEQGIAPLSTVYQTKAHVTRFKTFLKEKKLYTNIEIVPDSILSNYISYFSFSLRIKKNEFYSSPSLVCIRG